MSKIKSDKNGKYYFVISAGFYPDGRRKQVKRSGFSSKKEAQLEYDKIKGELATESYIDASSVTFGELSARWLSNKKYTVQRTTY